MNARATRVFEDKASARERVPVLLGIMGPSGGGKTFSMLRVATGIQSIVGGDIYVIDTEARRALHYADHFKFRHIDFKAPFGSLDYLDAIQHCASKKAGVICIDSMSHEHEGVGGHNDMHDRELDRMAGDDIQKRERVNMLAWAKPKEHRKRLLQGILHIESNFIFCFRAKETAKPTPNRQTGKVEIVQQGFMPIAGEEFIYEMTTCCLLLPNAGGVPTWQTQNPGERRMIKPAEQFGELFREARPLDEQHGVGLARWAMGDRAQDRLDIADLAREAAAGGSDVFSKFYLGCSNNERKQVERMKDELVPIKAKADAEQAERAKQGAML